MRARRRRERERVRLNNNRAMRKGHGAVEENTGQHPATTLVRRPRHILLTPLLCLSSSSSPPHPFIYSTHVPPAPLTLPCAASFQKLVVFYSSVSQGHQPRSSVCQNMRPGSERVCKQACLIQSLSESVEAAPSRGSPGRVAAQTFYRLSD